jgi:dienelactone hydrolase
MASRSVVSKALRPLVLTRLMLFGGRAPLDRTPEDVGLPYEDVEFESADSVPLRGWFVPRAGGDAPGPAIVFVHGWLWNRLGNRGGHVPFADLDVDFLVPARALHDAGFHVLLFDLRNHGESGSARPVTYGPREARDYVAAVEFVRQRSDVDGERIGAIGYSMGAGTVLYGTPDCQPIRALLAVQPARIATFNRNFSRTEWGRIGPLLILPVEPLYRLMRAPPPSKHDPAVPAARLGDTVVQYVQGTGDPWGTTEDVEAMAAATPNALPIIRHPTTARFEGYGYVEAEVDAVVEFFRRHV